MNNTTVTPEMKTKIEQFSKMLLEQTQSQMIVEGLTHVWQNETVKVHYGKKFIRVDIGPQGNMSGRYMVEIETGIIFGIKAYGVVHRGHRYGTLDTINDYFWGGYRGIKVQDGTSGQDRESYSDDQDRESYISN